MLFSIFRLALRSVQRNMLRSFLTILGIVIGVSAVVTMVTLGNGATQSIQAQITSLGTNLLIISPGQRQPGGTIGARGVADFTEADAQAILSQIGGVAAVAPQDRISTRVVANGRNWATNVTGSTNAWFQTGNWKVAGGRSFGDDEQQGGAAVCIVGETVRREIYGGAVGQTGHGQALRIKQFSCTVVGVLAAKGQGGLGDQDDLVLVPLATLHRRVSGNHNVGAISVSMEDGTDSTRLKASLRQLLRERRKLSGGQDDNFNIFDTQQLAETLASTTGVLTTLLGAVAAVSLLVGGIGIMNIMLVSVTERTREIGIRRAIGAKKRSIMVQFLCEAVVLSEIGGLLGVVLGILAGNLLGLALHAPPIIPYDWALIGLVVCSFVGVAFGTYPAWLAANLDPIESLRYE